MDNLNYLNISSYWKTITDYFINNTIIINDNDDYKIYFEKFLLKYKRVIGLVLLILLLIIGYFDYNSNSNTNTNINGNGNKINLKQKQQFGGASDPASVPPPAHMPPAGMPPAGMPTSVSGIMKQGSATGVSPTKLGIAKGLASKGLGKGYGAGAYVAQGIRNNADWFYGMLYAIAISLAVFMVTIPSISFFIVGIICYFLLKDKMKTLKGL